MVAGTSFGYPYGQGAAARAHLYAKALQAAGFEPLVVSLLLPSGKSPAATEPAAGVYDGVPYEYACGTRTRPDSFLRRRLLSVRLAARLVSLTRGLSDGAAEPGAVIVYSESSCWMTCLALVARACGAVTLLDVCEFPLVGRIGEGGALQRWVRRALVYPLFDGVIPISTFLAGYVRAHALSPRTLLVPVMVDSDLFRPAPERRPGGPRVLYCGALGRLPEVERVVRGFAAVREHVPGARLVVVGDGPPDRVAQAHELVAALGLHEHVTFTGAVERDRLPDVYASADVFVLPRARGLFSTAGLPNKMGEYLAMGRPLVVSAVGDVSRYVEDGVSAYLFDADADDVFVARLRDALEDHTGAAQVGAEGRRVAEHELDYRHHAPRLARFLSDLVAQRSRRRPWRGRRPTGDPDAGPTAKGAW